MKKGVIGTTGIIVIVVVIFSVMVGIGIFFNINSEDIDPPVNFPVEGSCGNGICEVGEYCSSCSSDCGVCGSNIECDESLRNTVGLINQANYCDVDSDCIISKDIWFCYIITNKDADLISLREKAKKHMEICPAEADCEATPNQEKIKCENNKCVVSTSSGTCGNGICDIEETRNSCVRDCDIKGCPEGKNCEPHSCETATDCSDVYCPYEGPVLGGGDSAGYCTNNMCLCVYK